ncbi:hypothetical protein TVAGG3_0943050, partial [Trichomonas vaginalis G3]
LAVVLKQKSFFVNVKDTHYTVIKNSNIDFFSIALNLSEQKEYKKGETNVKYYPSSLKTITNKDVIQKFLPKVEEASIDIDEGSEMVEEIDPDVI